MPTTPATSPAPANAPTMLTTNAGQAWLPEDIGNLVIKPVASASLPLAVLGYATAPIHTTAYRVPIINTDPVAAWVAEGSEISPSNMEVSETGDIFHKVAGLTIISREMAEDASPDISQQIGLGLGRDIARRIDEAFFGKRDTNTLAPRGLEDLTNTATVTAPATWENTDPFVQAIYQANTAGVTLTAFAAHPDDALALAQLKDQTDSQRPLLGPDPTNPTLPLIAGVPLYTSPAITPGTVWGLPASAISIAIREDVTLTRDDSVFFTSDRIALRATLRTAFLYPHEEAIQKITKASK